MIDATRRAFMAGSAGATGLLLAGPSGASAKGSQSAVSDVFGPKPGQALLSRNENPFGPAPSALQAIAEVSDKGCYYADRGVERLAAMIAERHGVSVEQVVIGSGSTEILSAISLAWGAKGAILCPGLFWDTTVQYGERQGVSAIRVPLRSDMNVDLAAIEAAVDDRVSLIQICNPNNPTGMLVDMGGLRRLASSVTPNTTLLVDEAYNELADDPESSSVMDLVRQGEDVIVCRTFSKIYGMAGLRVGYAITTEENAALIRSHLMSFGGNVAGLAGAIASYDDRAFLGHSRSMILEGREMILDAVARSGLTALPSQTNFVYVEVSDADAVRRKMAERDISIRGAYGKWTQYSRVSTGKLEDVARYARALPQIVEELEA